MGQNGKMGGVVTIQGQMVKSPFKVLGRIKDFSSFCPIFPLVPPKNLASSPPYKFVFEINKDRFISSRGLES